jgi:hypothetical protein
MHSKLHLNDADLKTIAKLRRSQEAWRWLRWLLLIVGAVCTITFAYLFLNLYGFFRAQQYDANAIGSIAFYSGPLFCIFLISWLQTLLVIRLWNGRPTTRLLLRLLEEEEYREG